MVDLQEKHKGNISLPARLQSPDATNIKPKNEDDHPTIVNVQKAMYEVILNDLQRKIERLQIRNEDLENFCDKVKSSSENVDQESELEIVQLNNNIAIEVKKVNELKKRCDEIEASRENEKLRHLEKIRQMEENFEKTRIQLYSEIKTISAKINMIDEYKLADEGLRKKLNDKIETTLRKEDEMEKTLTRLNYKSKIHKENLKKEAYKKILDTSETFQLELKDTTSPTEQRLMRENIVLENELDRLWNDHSNMQAVDLKHIDTIKEYHDKIKEAKSNTKRRLIACKIQNLLIKKLQSVRSKVEKELGKSFQTAKHFEERYLQLLDKTKNAEFSTDNIRKRKLEVMLHQERVKLALTNAFKIQSLSAFERVSRTLSSLKNAVDSALMITKHDANEELKNMNLQAFGNHLLNIIEDCESEKWIAKSESTETVADLLNVYVTGDLGFEPKHIQIIEQVSPEMHKSESKSVLSTLEILKELEQLPTASEKQQQSVSSRKSSHNSGSTDIFNSSATTINESEVSKNESADRVEERETISVEEEEDDYEEEDVSDYDVSQLEYEIEDFENTVNLG
ncbi:DNA ligase 1-like [Nasonia vitripennis]|uniref:Cilia- and flagella-associated protein 157 n=1 Tax=Nasonia vitripennis TaxID=7425 RepID=A0A7M7G3G1_NASVI|nr:DNA ligase 1-like [Nasonia vitripennis]